MNIWAFLILGLVAAIGAAMAFVRLAPNDPAVWHTDPATAADPGLRGHQVSPPDAPVFDARPADLLRALDEIALAEPRVRRFAGDPSEGWVTYITRTRVFGFPDFISVKALAQDNGATLAILGRCRFCGSDLDVNQTRMESWLGRLQGALPG